jgi:hypothetical protein
MNVKPYITEIDKQIAKLQSARTALLSLESAHVSPKTGRLQGSDKPERKVSPDVRSKISAAQKKRWAAAKESV